MDEDPPVDDEQAEPNGQAEPNWDERSDPSGHDPELDEVRVTRVRPERRGSRRRLALLISLIVASAAVVFIAAMSSRATPATTTVTVKPTTTSSIVVPWPATEARIATAKSPTIVVHADPPAGWDTMKPAVEWDNPAPPASQAAMPPRPALPRADYPIKGRYVSATGWSFNNPTSWGGPFVMLMTEQRGDWLKVEIPVRPNGTPGYVAASDVTMSSTDYHLDLRLGTRTLTLFQGRNQVLSTPVVIGKPETQTPTGRFYITDKVPQDNPAGAYGPIALPTNAYSEQIDQFDNGVPVIALHGTNRPELVGQTVSNGCIRVPNEQILKIDSLIPPGTPIDIAA